MKSGLLKQYMRRAGVGSRRELSELTGIPSRTLDRIFEYPRQARGFQLDAIGTALNLTDAETRNLIRKGETCSRN